MRALAVALLACCGGTTADPSATATLSGTLTMYEGDCMPVTSPDVCVVSHPSRAVYLFPLQYFDQNTHVFPTTLDVPPVAQTTSDGDGHYTMRAPPGRWSLFVEDQGQLYANSVDSTDDAITPVDLVDGIETTRDVMINHATW